MRILVDADACPVKQTVVRLAKERNIPVTMLIDTSHELNDGYSTIITVDKQADSVDFALMGLLKREDLVVTQDYGLAAMVIGKGARVVNQNGLIFSDANMDILLMKRHIGEKIRRGGGRTKGPAKRAKEDDARFEAVLKRLLGGTERPDMPFTIIRNDIIKMNTDAIVNAANTDLAQGGGVCGAIFKAAGADKLRSACDKLAPIETGDAVITPGFDLPAKHIIHTAGPVYRGGKQGEAELLRSCYLRSLELAEQNGCESIAFPLISSGIYGYPKTKALRVATEAIQDFLAGHKMDVYLAVFDKDARTIGKALYGDIERYIDQHYVDEHFDSRRSQKLLDVERSAIFADQEMLMPAPAQMPSSAQAIPLDDVIGNLDEPFSATLLRLIDAKGKTDVEVYKRANLDRKLFSKIRTGKKLHTE